MSQTAQHVVAVGGVVLHDQAVLLVRQTYGPARGRYLFPGGHVAPGETLDQAVIREVHEETGLATRVLGLVGIRTRCDGTHADTYVMFLLEPLGGTLQPDGHEHDDARFFTREELGDPATPITDLSRYVALRIVDGRFCLQPLAEDFDYAAAGRDPQYWRLFC